MLEQQKAVNTELSQFLDHLAFERRLSEHTVAAYRADLEHFFAWIRQKFRLTNGFRFLRIIICANIFLSIFIATKISASPVV